MTSQTFSRKGTSTLKHISTSRLCGTSAKHKDTTDDMLEKVNIRILCKSVHTVIRHATVRAASLG